jgi:hypothetical protein
MLLRRQTPSGPALPLHADSIVVHRRRTFALLITTSMCGSLQLLLAFTIPFFDLGLLGLVLLGGSILFMRELWLDRMRYLTIGIFQPVLVCLLVYIDYTKLAEALDRDSYYVATEDDLERTVQSNIADRVAAYTGIAIDCLMVVLSFFLAESMFMLRAAYFNQSDDDPRPWLLQFKESLELEWAYERQRQLRMMAAAGGVDGTARRPDGET